MRQRMIKPEFFDSESLASCSWGARLAFVGLWCCADDEGNCKLQLGRLRSHIFDDDCTDDEFGAMLAELEAVDCIRIYTDSGKAYISLPNFNVYQTINKPTKSTIPKPSKRLGQTHVLKAVFELIQGVGHEATTVVGHGLTTGIVRNEIKKEIKKEEKGAGGGASDAAPIPFDDWKTAYMEAGNGDS